jgi:hypothetical protein
LFAQEQAIGKYHHVGVVYFEQSTHQGLEILMHQGFTPGKGEDAASHGGGFMCTRKDGLQGQFALLDRTGTEQAVTARQIAAVGYVQPEFTQSIGLQQCAPAGIRYTLGMWKALHKHLLGLGYLFACGIGSRTHSLQKIIPIFIRNKPCGVLRLEIHRCTRIFIALPLIDTEM